VYHLRPVIEDIPVIDCEVIGGTWIVCVDEKAYWDNRPDDVYALKKRLKDIQIWSGYNAKHYDQYILIAILNGLEASKIQKLNDLIIREKIPGYKTDLIVNCEKKPYWTIIDTMDDLGGVRLGLKEIEGNMGMSIEESSVSFDRPVEAGLTNKERREVTEYCLHDVRAAKELLLARRQWIESKFDLCHSRNINPWYAQLTNAQLIPRVLTCNKTVDRSIYPLELPNTLDIKRYQAAVEFISKAQHGDQDIQTFNGVEHHLGVGGLHGAIKNYHQTSFESESMYHVDVTSYYPSLMIKYNTLSRAAVKPEEFKKIFDERVEAKQNGKKQLADTLKLVINTTFGACAASFNPLYDPSRARDTTQLGQLFLIDLIEKLENKEIKLIQSNTDGLIVSVKYRQMNDFRKVVHEWQKRTGFNLETEYIKELWQSDVNSYAYMDSEGVMTHKGSRYTTSGGWMKNSLTIVSKMFVNCLFYDIKPEETLKYERDAIDYQIIAKHGPGYAYTTYNGVKVQKVNRVFATTDSRLGTLYKHKSDNKFAKIPNLPKHCIIYNDYLPDEIDQIDGVDYQWYINLAYDWLDDLVNSTEALPLLEC
jgi:hypothetical protein